MFYSVVFVFTMHTCKSTVSCIFQKEIVVNFHGYEDGGTWEKVT